MKVTSTLLVTLLTIALLGCTKQTAPTDSTRTPPKTQAAPSATAAAPATTDAQRIADVRAIAALVEEFKRITGHYPYEEAFINPEPGFVAVPVMVIVTSQQLPEPFRSPPPGMSVALYPNEEFSDLLAETLGREVALPSDNAPPPRFYQYQFDGKNYFVSTVLESGTPETREMAPGWYKYQIGSTGIPSAKVIRFVENE
jgi:hypothetical protein